MHLRTSRRVRRGVAAVVLVVAGVARAGAPVPAPGPPADFVELAQVAPDIAVDMRYAGPQNFVGRPVRGYDAARCWLTRRAAEALARVQQDLRSLDLGLLVYDCYRPRRAVADFVAWSRTADDAAASGARGRFYPTVPKDQLFARGYIAERSSHSRGSTVDLTLAPRGWRRAATPAPGAPDCRQVDGRLAPDGSLNMGTTFDCLDERSHTDDAATSPAARQNRQHLRRAMQRRGFAPYAKEWWHFTLAQEPHPETSFDFVIEPDGHKH